MTDILDKILTLQREFDLQVQGKPPKTDEERALWLIKLCTALNSEVGELLNTTHWKWWSRSKRPPINIQEAKEELIDVFIFVCSALNLLGMSSRDVETAYLDKLRINKTRQQ